MPKLITAPGIFIISQYHCRKDIIMTQIPNHENTTIHPEVIKRVSQTMPDEEQILDLADLFKLFADSTRVRILFALMKTEMCVYDLSALLQVSQSAVSHQLRLLRNAKLVKNRREGKIVYYSSDDYHVDTVLNLALEHLKEEKRPYTEDLE